MHSSITLSTTALSLLIATLAQAGDISFTNPVAGKVCVAEQACTVSWTSAGPPLGNDKLALKVMAGDLNSLSNIAWIGTPTASDKTMTFKVPKDWVSAPSYVVVNVGPSGETYSSAFTIQGVSGTIPPAPLLLPGEAPPPIPALPGVTPPANVASAPAPSSSSPTTSSRPSSSLPFANDTLSGKGVSSVNSTTSSSSSHSAANSASSLNPDSLPISSMVSVSLGALALSWTL
ncbi:MAG: hypothetical protein DHS80DRAFT_26393 [Piptocephalis tieghemiana]|nr:MAG: hypothetical protein DHS80DRAFT_26393 [Piptocephalis tieghemiana]